MVTVSSFVSLGNAKLTVSVSRDIIQIVRLEPKQMYKLLELLFKQPS